MAEFNSKRWLISRRRALCGLGVSIGLPLLDCMYASDRVQHLEITSDSKPARSVFIYVPNGVNTLTWQIKSAGREYQLPSALEALEDYRDVITPISGLHHPGAIGKAHQCDKVWLTGASIGNDINNFRNTISADQLMAEHFAKSTRFPSLELCVTSGTLAWNRLGVPLPSQRKPSAVFKQLFVADPGGNEAARRKLAKRSSILDVVLEDANSLRNSIGAKDKRELDQYLQSVREVEQRIGQAEAWLNKPLPTIEPGVAERLNRNIPDSKAGDYYRTMYDLIVLALRTDMTRVVTCMSGSESQALALPEIGIQQSRHELSHHNNDPEQMKRLTQCDRFLTEQFAYFVDQLNSYDEQGESLLDRTMVLFGSGMSYGHNHGTANLPLILAGGKSLGIKHGQHVDFNLPVVEKYELEHARNHYEICLKPVDSNARMSNLLLTMLQSMGIKTDRFADSTGSISSLLK